LRRFYSSFELQVAEEEEDRGLISLSLSLPPPRVAPKSNRGTAIILFVVYLAYLYFQLKSHADLFLAEEAEEEEEEEEAAMGLWSSGVALLVVTLLTAFCAGTSLFLFPLHSVFFKELMSLGSFVDRLPRRLH